MITSDSEFAASLRYAARWADTLEGMRREALETDGALLPTFSAGPLNEIRRALAEMQEYVARQQERPEIESEDSGSFGTARNPAPSATAKKK